MEARGHRIVARRVAGAKAMSVELRDQLLVPHPQCGHKPTNLVACRRYSIALWLMLKAKHRSDDELAARRHSPEVHQPLGSATSAIAIERRVSADLVERCLPDR